MNPERGVDVEWNEDFTETYPVKIRVRSNDRFGLLADITGTLSKSGANILTAHAEIHEDKMVDSYFTISVESIDQLNRIISALKKVKFVQSVGRVYH
jgi:GTP pyrophosphokinase